MKFIQVRPVSDVGPGINLRPAISHPASHPGLAQPAANSARAATAGLRAHPNAAFRAKADTSASDAPAKFVYSENIKLGGYAWIKFC